MLLALHQVFTPYETMKPMSEVQQIQLCIDHHAEEHSSMILVGVYWEIPIFQISQRIQSSLQVHLCK